MKHHTTRAAIAIGTLALLFAVRGPDAAAATCAEANFNGVGLGWTCAGPSFKDVCRRSAPATPLGTAHVGGCATSPLDLDDIPDIDPGG